MCSIIQFILVLKSFFIASSEGLTAPLLSLIASVCKKIILLHCMLYISYIFTQLPKSQKHTFLNKIYTSLENIYFTTYPFTPVPLTFCCCVVGILAFVRILSMIFFLKM